MRRGLQLRRRDHVRPSVTRTCVVQAGGKLGRGRPIGFGNGIVSLRMTSSATGANLASISAQRSGRSARSYGSAARKSVVASTCDRTAAPSFVSPDLWSRPRSASRVLACCCCSPLQPRLSKKTSGCQPCSAAISRWASQPSMPALASAATWPSPRCSRRVVQFCHNCATGSSRRAMSRFAAKRGRPIDVAPEITASRSSLTAVAACSMPGEIRRSADAAARARTNIRSEGSAYFHASGMARRTIAGAKFANAASTTPASTGPSGQARNAK